MQKKRTTGLLLLLLLLIFTRQGYAQSRQFQHITSADGISQSEVYSFLEDARGFMWFGTVDGLNRYDGYSVTVFHIDKDSPNSIPNNTIRCLVEDAFGRIWIGTDDGLCVYDPRTEKIDQVPLNTFNERRLTVNTAVIDDERLYIGTSLGLLSLDVSRHSPEEMLASAELLKLAGEDGPYEVVACKAGQRGNIWLTTASSLHQLQLTDEGPIVTKLLDLRETLPNIRNLEEDSSGNLWIVSYDNGFIRYKPDSKELKHFKEDPGNSGTLSSKISTVTADQKGNLWIGTHDKGLLFLEKAQLNAENPAFQSIEHDPYNNRSLSSNLVYSLFVSRSNLLWVGTIGAGISIYDPNRKPFRYYGLHNADNPSLYSNNFIRAVYADAEDNVWVGAHNNGLFFFEKGHFETMKKIGFGAESVFHLSDAGGGNTLVCTGIGVSLVRRAQDGLQLLSSQAIGPTFYAVAVEEGVFWLATLNGLKKCRLANGKIVIEEEYTTDSRPAISFNNCRVLHFNPKTRELFVGTEGGGLNVLQLDEQLSPTQNRVFKKGDSINAISNNYVRSIIQGSGEDLWIGTYEGLNKMSTNTSTGEVTFKLYTMENGLSNNTIQSIVEDKQHNLWIGTNQGLCQFNPETEVFTKYSLNDGIQSNEFSEDAIFRKPDDEIIIGGINGINTFYPEQIGTSAYKPNVTLTNFYLFNKEIGVDSKSDLDELSPLKKSISLTDSLFLKHYQNSIGFDFSAMIFNAPEKVQYAYFLEGFDEDWTITNANNRKANYTNLGFGDYTFQVKATDNDGVWDDTPRSVFLSIKPPIYRTTFAYLLYALLGILAFVFFTNYSVLRYTTKKEILLENKLNKKVRELEEMRTRFFINISHDLRTPLTLISSPLELLLKKKDVNPEVKGLMNLMHRNVKKLRDITEQLLDIRKVEAGSLAPKVQSLNIVSFVKGEASLFKNAFSDIGVNLAVESEAEEMDIPFDPDMISKVIFNMLSNALKHTPAGTVDIRISKVSAHPALQPTEDAGEGFIKIDVEDTGNGIAPADLPRVFDRFYQGKEQDQNGYGIGLSHCKDLIEAHNGHIAVASEIGVGTTFSVYLPDIQREVVSVQAIPPAAETPNSPTTETIAATEEADSSLRPEAMQVLLVEDNLDLRNFIAQELRKQYRVLEAEDGEKGLEMAKEHFPDLIISDVMMPRMDGMEFCSKIKSTLKTSHIPVILLTAKVNKEAKYEGFELGADDYIPKPFDLDFLFLRIKNLLKNRERMRKIFQGTPNFEPSKVTVTSLDEEFLANLIPVIEEGISDAHFSISTLEQKLGMSHASFYNKVKSLTGQSAKELLFSMRMKRAKQILEDTGDIRISEVTYMVGFTDPKYFSKRFKEFFGASPSSVVKK